MSANDNDEKNPTQSLAWLGVTTAAWAHRTGNTLGVIQAYVSSIRGNLDNKEFILEKLEKIDAAVRRQLELTDELRGFSRISAGSGIGPTSVNSVIRNTVNSFYKSVDTPTIHLKLSRKIPEARTDEKLLVEVLRNLLDNSISAIKNQVDGEIKIKTYLVGKNIAIDISDNGKGFPLEVAETIFKEPIPRSQSKGLGIGLLISRTLIEAWDGSIRLIESGKKGTTIQVILTPWETPKIISGARNAIIVDDDPSWTEVLQDLLANRGLSVDSTYSLKEAIRLVDEKDYDLAILDLRLTNDLDQSDVTGLNIARLLHERNPNTIVIMLTAYAAVPIMREASKAGVSYVFDKMDFSIDRLNTVINEIAVRNEKERESLRQNQLDKTVYEILSMISHELRTPLLTAQRSAEALELGALGNLNEDQKEAVKVIRSSLHREFILLNAHLDLNRIERGVEKFDYQEYDLISLIREEVDAHRPEAASKKIKLQTRLPTTKAKVRIDVNRFRVALNPLMDNAIKFSPEGCTVTIKARFVDQTVEVSVSDQGPGMKPQEFDWLLKWDNAERTNLAPRTRSSGLGLSMSKRMIELHGGRIWVESDGEHGTTVFFRLPYRK